jgi:hypothetical protein
MERMSHLHLVARSRMVEPCLYSSIRLPVMVFYFLRTETLLPSLHYYLLAHLVSCFRNMFRCEDILFHGIVGN